MSETRLRLQSQPAQKAVPEKTTILRRSLVLGLVITAAAAAQTLCPDLATATGQTGWTLVSGPGIPSPKAPVNVSPYAGWGVLPQSNWISVDAGRGGAGGDFVFEYSFCLCNLGRPSALSLAFLADNGASVFINGNQVFATKGDKNFTGTPSNVAYNGPWSSGTNKLRIVVHNESSVTGLDAVLHVTGATSGACPEACPTLTSATGQAGWKLVSGPGVSSPKTPVNVAAYAGWGLLPNSSWVSVDANRGNAPGDYAYEYAFCACKQPAEHALSLRLFADNGAKVFLNGTQLPPATTGNKNFTGTPLTVASNGPFLSGQNKVRVLVSNEGSVTGLDAVLSVTGATSACP